MATHTDCAPGEATADEVVVQPNRPDQGASGDTITKCARQVQTDRSLFEQFMKNLMVALGALPI